MKSEKFLDLAIKLHKSDDADEATLRTSISRSYYAIFNHVKDFFDDNDIGLPESAEGHVKAYRYLYNSGIDEAKDLAQTLTNLREKRNDADYELHASNFTYDKKNCGLISGQAKNFFNIFDKINTDSLVNGINDYKKKTNN